jgi:hypothetical protein
VAVVAVLAGAYWRFRGLSSAPFAVDEYYLARSIENVLRTGIPAFDCGGLYMRGIVLQYTAAVMQLGGLTPEFAPRLISAICSLLTLPAVFLLGRRTRGPIVGLLAVTIMALSVWEIEMARFGRMYAPFQAIFLWYVVFFLRYVIDRETRALYPMLGLSVLGPLVWEGGVFLPLANILSSFVPRWPQSLARRDWLYLLSCTLLLGLAVWFVTADFRGYNADSWPPGYSRSLSTAVPDSLTSLRMPLGSLRRHIAWIGAALVPLAATLFSLRWIWSLRSRPFLVVGLSAMLIAAVFHQFLLLGAIGLLLLLTQLISWQELFSRRALWFNAALVLFFVFWIAYGIAIIDWRGLNSRGLARSAATLVYQLFKFPDMVGVVIRPWARAVPHLGLALLGLIALAIYRVVRYDSASDYERTLLTLFLVLLLAASASPAPRQETRYVFFLYPVVIVIAVSTIAWAVALVTSRRAIASAATSIIALGGFAFSEDLNPRHVLHIDSPEETFRVNMTPAMQSHLVFREDYRSLSFWLKHYRAPDDLVVNGVHGFDHYYSSINYFYVEEHSPNFPDWTCRRGSVDRWSNYPLLYSVEGLTARVTERSKAYLVAFSYDRDDLLHSLAALHPQVVTSSGDVIIIQLSR